jgi:hypothetical protein
MFFNLWIGDLSNFMQFHYHLILHQKLLKFYIICNDSQQKTKCSFKTETETKSNLLACQKEQLFDGRPSLLQS